MDYGLILPKVVSLVLPGDPSSSQLNFLAPLLIQLGRKKDKKEVYESFTFTGTSYYIGLFKMEEQMSSPGFSGEYL